MSHETLTQILEEKISKRIEAGVNQSRSILQRIESEGNVLNDFIVPLGSRNEESRMMFSPVEDNGIYKVDLSIKNGSERHFSMHPHATMQAGDKLGIPGAYIRNLAESRKDWAVSLAARTLNEHSLHTQRQRVLVRSIDTEIRGVLSDQYRRLNTPEIYKMFIQSCRKADAQIYSAMVTDTKSSLEALIPTLINIPTEKNGIVSMAFGFRISNSDFGDGALEFRMFMVQAICLNGMVTDSMIREIHLGKRISEDFNWSERTYKLIRNSKRQRSET